MRVSFHLILVSVIALHTARANAPHAEESNSGATHVKSMEMMQGKWKVFGVFLPSLSDDGRIPEELRFTEQGAEIVIEGNSILSHGKLVATFASDLNLPHQKNELGFKRWHLIMLTLPTGKGVLCSYELSGDKLEIAYTHKCACHRGSRHILALERMTK